ERCCMVRSLGVAIEREMFLYDGGAERDRGQRYFKTVGVIGVADGQAERGAHRLHGREIYVLGRAGIVGGAVKQADLLREMPPRRRIAPCRAERGNPGRILAA